MASATHEAGEVRPSSDACRQALRSAGGGLEIDEHEHAVFAKWPMITSEEDPDEHSRPQESIELPEEDDDIRRGGYRLTSKHETRPKEYG